MIKFVISDVALNQLGLPICGHKKELMFWEKQIIGIGDFAENFQCKVDLNQQESMIGEVPQALIDVVQKENGGRVLDVIDVGAGVISLLSHAHHTGKIELTATDFLSDEYLELLRVYGYLPAVGSINIVACSAESLADHFAPNSFDLVYCNNALDHTDSPTKSFGNMVSVVKKDGYVLISGNSREGTKEGWDGIHNHDLYVDDGKLIRAGRDEIPICVSDGQAVEMVSISAPADQFGEMAIVFRKVDSEVV